MRPLAAQLALGAAHEALIEQSHQRCHALGLSRIEKSDYAPLGRPDLALVRERNHRLLNHAAPVMEMLAEQISGTQSMVVLCDSAGTIIHSIGDDEFLSRASKVALQPGVNWSEQSKGTNAIGTALMAETPTVVHADEHFMHANHFLTCSAVPILDPRGNILGVLDVTGDHRSYHPHTMALVKMSARMIENQWLIDDHRHALRLHFHPRPEFIDTLMEGVLAVAPDGRVVGANRAALVQLGLSSAALRRHSMSTLFGLPVAALVDRFRSPLATPMEVQTAEGRTFHVHGRLNWSAWGRVAAAPLPLTELAVDWVTIQPPAPALAPAAPAPAAGSGPLATWLTGDATVAALVHKLQRVLDSGLPITLVGDTGTGKEVLARALHKSSARAKQPLVVQRCAGLTEQARIAWPELLAQASGGMLLLDDVGQLPAHLQAPLLHALDARAGTDTVALLCTSALPWAQTGLRDDLQHRLAGLTVALPPLRERSDLPALAHRILAETDPLATLRGDTLALLQTHDWPGNLRELQRVLHTASLLAGPRATLAPEHLPDALQRSTAAEVGTASAPAKPTDAGASLHALEMKALRDAVNEAGGNIALAARRLGVARNTIYRRLRWTEDKTPR